MLRILQSHSAGNAMDFTPFLEQELGEIGTILTGNTCDQCLSFHDGLILIVEKCSSLL
jgi:hypothetical protein